MKIKVNNEEREIAVDTNVSAIVGSDTAGTAVAVNGRIVKKPDWETTMLHDGDDMVIIKAAYGG